MKKKNLLLLIVTVITVFGITFSSICMADEDTNYKDRDTKTEGESSSSGQGETIEDGPYVTRKERIQVRNRVDFFYRWSKCNILARRR